MNGVIYKKTSPSGKSYIGQTWNYDRRMAYYRRGSCEGQRALYGAIIKYGIDNFTDEILESGIKTQEELDVREEYWIAALNTLSPHGYNLKTGGGGGGSPCDETRAKISAGNKGRKHTPEWYAKQSAAKRGENNPNFGKPAWNRGKSPSLKTRAKQSAKMRGENNPMFGKRGENAPNFGKSPSLETRAKQSAKMRGRKHTPEACAKMSKSRRGRKQTPEHVEKKAEANREHGRTMRKHRAKISASNKGKNKGKKYSPLSLEHRAKISAALRGKKKK